MSVRKRLRTRSYRKAWAGLGGAIAAGLVGLLVSRGVPEETAGELVAVLLELGSIVLMGAVAGGAVARAPNEPDD